MSAADARVLRYLRTEARKLPRAVKELLRDIILLDGDESKGFV